jgi:signal transduction histidine kinase
MVKVSLRASLVGLWLLILIICLALAALMTGLFKLGVSAEIKSVQREVLSASRAMQQRFDVYLRTYSPPPKDFSEDQKRRELGLIAQLVLADYKGVEGGFWGERGGFVAYAFPTYEGERPKKDVPEAEEGRIARVAADALQNRAPQERRFDSQTQSLILCARPVGGSEQTLVAWTMARAHVSVGAAYQRLTVGFVILFTFALASGIWLLWFLQRWSRRIALLEESIAAAPVEEMPPLPETGQIELDRIVMALNRLNSKLKRSREESYELSRSLAKADRSAVLGRMAAEVAHEIRNPIATMRLRAENALAKSAEHHRAALEFIMPEILRLDDLLERLLAVARLDELKFSSVHLRSWLAQRIEALRERAEQGSVLLTGEAPDVEWRFDERRMARALDNLILNGLHFTPAAGWVKVTIDTYSSLCHIIVEDSGPGIPPEQRETIFEPLHTTRSEGGGLGLGIAREIVEAHGGTLRCVDSPAGARFEIELPWQKS